MTTKEKVLGAIAAVGFTLGGVAPLLRGREFNAVNAIDLAIGVFLFLGLSFRLRRRPSSPSGPGA